MHHGHTLVAFQNWHFKACMFSQKKRTLKLAKIHLFQKKPVKDNSQRSPKHTLISGKAAGVSLAHGMWCWCDCWNCPDITVCVQFHSGNSQLEFSSLVHNEDSQPLGMTTDCAKDRGAGGGVQGAGGRPSYLKLHSHGHCNSAGILYQSGCSLSWSSGLTMIWENVNIHNTVLSLQQQRLVLHALHDSLQSGMVTHKKVSEAGFWIWSSGLSNSCVISKTLSKF